MTQTLGSLSLNLFVPPGTIESMRREADGAAGWAQPVSVLAIANEVGPSTWGQSEAVRSPPHGDAGSRAQVLPAKQLLLADADAQRRFTELFRAFGLFSVLVASSCSLALTVLILVR